MFDNIGEKLMTLAKIIFWVMLLSGAIAFIYFASWAEYGIAFLILAGSALTGYVSAMYIYGFGQLVSDVHSLRKPKQPHRRPEKRSAEIDSNDLPEL